MPQTKNTITNPRDEKDSWCDNPLTLKAIAKNFTKILEFWIIRTCYVMY